MDHAVRLLRDVGRLLTRSHDIEATLGNVVRLVARWMRAGGGSIYLLDPDGTLVMRATRGLHAAAVGRVRLKAGEGIVGAALHAGEAVAVPDTRLDTRFLLFPGSGEERFRSLLAVPLRIGELSIGVLTVQTPRPRVFSSEEIELLETIAAQVASIVANARLLDSILRGARPLPATPEETPEPHVAGTVLQGIAISPGIAFGPVHLHSPPFDVAALDYEPAATVRAEWRAVQNALRQTIRQLSDLRGAVGERLGEEFADVFTTHIMILEDQGFREKLQERVKRDGDGVQALNDILAEYVAVFAVTPDLTIRDRATDVQDVIHRVVTELVGVRRKNTPLKDGVIVIAERTVPSDFALLETEKIAGMVSEHGGPVSHAAIFARALEIPAVSGIGRLQKRVCPGNQVIVDGFEGLVIVNPPPEILEDYQHRAGAFRRARGRLDELHDLPSRTLDGVDIRLSANIGNLTDLDLALRYGARGVGLFRTEILALSARGFPDQEEQQRVYRKVAERVAPEPVNIRLFDLGGEKAMSREPLHEENPQLGWRSIRILLDRPDIFTPQLSAILRANNRRNVRLLIPMVTSMEELDQVRARLDEQCDQLDLSEPPPLGVMIETPAAVAIADQIVQCVDFISIGTNDLTQYTLAMDRENERVAASWDPFHPAILRQLRSTALAAREGGVDCAVCGELAGTPIGAPVLIGLGINELSMSSFSIALIRQVVRSIERKKAEKLAEDVVTCGRGSEVRELIRSFFEETALFEDRDFGPVLRRYLALRPSLSVSSLRTDPVS